MKSRSKDILDQAIAAMVAAIEIYKETAFAYRTESFAILAIKGWDLPFKAQNKHYTNKVTIRECDHAYAE